MRRRISLYIADRLVDLDDQSFILFNYRFEDLSNPTIVKNSYSKQITLKGTANNNAIFGDSFRTDRVVDNGGSSAGSDFNPSVKTPFTIYNELGEVLESGYVKLDSVTRKGVDIEYKVSLYGGLGSFLYALSYDEDGNKRTLANLDFLGTANPDAELDFTISAETVRTAWKTLHGDTSDGMWNIINFAPAYNGIPDSNFTPTKAIAPPSAIGLHESVIDDGVRYATKNGYCLVSMAEAQDEWAVKDLRSYLQRPVLSMRAFWDAIAKPENNGGYIVDKDIVDDYTRFNYNRLWMTLPMIPSLGTNAQTESSLSLALNSVLSSSQIAARIDVKGVVPSGMKVTANLYLKLQVKMSSFATAYASLASMARKFELSSGFYYKYLAVFVQAVAYGSTGTAVGGSKVVMLSSLPSSLGTSAEIASRCGYVPTWMQDDMYVRQTGGTWASAGDGLYRYPSELGFTVEAQDVSYYNILVSSYEIEIRDDVSIGGTKITNVSETYAIPRLYKSYDTALTALGVQMLQGDTANAVTSSAGKSLRSGARITKAMLLSTSHTPAEYLLSFCKMFGLYIRYDSASKRISILSRNELFQDETIDLTERVDLTDGITVTPFVFTSKWYDFKLTGVGGAFADEYRQTHGSEYGIQRVNTGYDFNSETADVMSSLVFKNAATILARSKYFNSIFTGGVFQPSPFIDKGNKYTLWSQDGETLETDISCPPANATVNYYNENGHEGYDVEEARKVEFRDLENKPVTGDDVLLILEGVGDYPYFKLTDDIPEMDLLNDGVPCWLLAPGDADGVQIPIFSRYTFGNGWTIDKGLDFGIPKELDIPDVKYNADATIYARRWKRYLEDRYDVNTKTMKCKVDFRGMQVSAELLRKFYYYDNALWVLNAISNYSLTTYDPVECEFVQVQDKDNYLNGQI